MKRIFAFLISVVMLASLCACDGGESYLPGSGTAMGNMDGGTDGTYSYKRVDGGIEIVKYLGSEADVVIPETINNQNVITIGASAFADRYTLKSVHIPATVTTIGKCAFRRCYKLETVTGCEGLRWVGDEAFVYDTSLRSFPWSETLTAIGMYSFSWCDSLEEITIVAGCDTIGDYAFRNCEAAATLTFEDSSVKAIGKEAFMCLSSVTSLCYPYATDFIGEGAFKHASSLTEVTFDPRVTVITNRAFQNSRAIKEIVIPAHITAIEDIAFGSCKALESVRVENPDISIDDIGIHLFLQLNDIVTVYCPEGSEMADYAQRNKYNCVTYTE